jgi:hypothetical protein
MLWPAGSSPGDDVKHACALLLHDSPNHVLDISVISQKISDQFKTAVNKLVYPERISTLLEHDPYCIKEYLTVKNGKNAQHYRLDLDKVLAAAGSTGRAGNTPPLTWQEDRVPFHPIGYRSQTQPAPRPAPQPQQQQPRKKAKSTQQEQQKPQLQKPPPASRLRYNLRSLQHVRQQQQQQQQEQQQQQ